jgi:hypothetical protein
MSIQNSIANWLAADGIPVAYASNINLNCNVPVYLPGPGISGVFTPVQPRSGYVRIKSNLFSTNTNVKVGPITATDGTNVANVYSGDANSGQNGRFYDETFFFWYDWAVSNINITNISVFAITNVSTFDVEAAGMM